MTDTVNLELYRTHLMLPKANVGVLVGLDVTPCVTMEQPWQPFTEAFPGRRYPAGVPFESCVPAGGYDLVWHRSPKYGDAWHLVSEWVALTKEARTYELARWACLVHSGNHVKDTAGCPLPGAILTQISGELGVNNSGFALGRLLAELPVPGPHKLRIYDAP